MGKGSSDRVRKRPEFNKGHTKTYGKSEKVDGRVTKKVVRNGKLVPKEDERSLIQTILPVDYSEYDKHQKFLQRQAFKAYGATPEQLGVKS